MTTKSPKNFLSIFFLLFHGGDCKERSHIGCGSVRVLVRTYVSLACIASVFRMERFGELGTLAVTSRLVVIANIVLRSPIVLVLMMETLRSSEYQFLQEPHGLTSHKTAFFFNVIDFQGLRTDIDSWTSSTEESSC
jgi:hypothetical protein